MKIKSGFACKVAAFVVFVGALLLLHPVSAETLADVDAEIQTDKTLIRVTGQDAYNVYAGVTNDRLDRKIAILNAAGITNFASSGKYSNFYSFTGQPGVTDTKIDIVNTTSTLRLYRRGDSQAKETQGYLGSWWGQNYLGINETRNAQAVLTAWGSDLKHIYVIDMPAGYSLVGGFASPMEKNGEYRFGGAYQYYYRGALRSWVVYALNAPDYLESYAAAVTGAQKAARNSSEDISGHLTDLRYQSLTERQPASRQLSNVWFRIYGGHSQYSDNSGDFSADAGGMHAGWEKMVKGGNGKELDHMHIGALIGRGTLNQNDSASGVKNSVTNNYAGLYGLYQSKPAGSRSWYGSAVAMIGRIEYNNQIPGESGYGLNQTYGGNVLGISMENGVTFRQTKGWFIEPQVQLLYTKILQNNFQDNLGATVSLAGNESLLGRIGVMVLRKIQDNEGRQTKFWVKASYLREFCGANTVNVAGDTAISNNGRNYYQVSAGTRYDIARNVSINADAARTFGDEQGYRFSLLMTKAW